MGETLRFELDADQVAKYEAWSLEQDKIAVAKQKAETKNPDAFMVSCWDAGHPYYGAIGGSDTFSFTMTSIGTSIALCIVDPSVAIAYAVITTKKTLKHGQKVKNSSRNTLPRL